MKFLSAIQARKRPKLTVCLFENSNDLKSVPKVIVDLFRNSRRERNKTENRQKAIDLQNKQQT